MGQTTKTSITSARLGFTALAGVASLLQAACQTTTGPASASVVSPAAPNYAYNNPQAVIPAGMPPVIYQQVAARDAELDDIVKDRIARVEKAMLRLDRRMQLIERNELSRMSGNATTSAPLTLSKNTSSPTPVNSEDNESVAMQALGIGPAVEEDASPAGFRPVADDGTTRIALQNTNAGHAVLGSAAMPSLADTAPSTGKAAQPATDVAVWTVRYPDSDNLWPDRSQLPLSRDVVEALRNGQNVTVFARGPNPNAKQFRERVKALSRYLAKVTSLDTVPISALPSPQLDAHTIEILATH